MADSTSHHSSSKDLLLIVDDDPLILKALEKVLEAPDRELICVHSGQEALDVLRKETVTLILCDQFMPGISGLEVLKESLRLQPDAVRMVLTGVQDLKTIEQLVNIGKITQFILKPWDNTTLGQIIHEALEKSHLLKKNRLLERLSKQQHEELEKRHASLQEEIHMSARVHEVLLLGKIPQNLLTVQLDALTIPSKEVDGDFFAFYQPSEDVLDVAVGDVMGKGLPAALVGTAVKSQLTRFAIPFNSSQMFSKSVGWLKDILSPDEILRRVHEETIVPLTQLEYFVTLTYGRFNFRKRIYSYVDCGSTKPLHYSFQKQTITLLEGNNFPLGFLEYEKYNIFEVPYHDKDLFIFYSDGVTEARSPDNVQFGLQKLIRIVKENCEATPTDLTSMIKSKIIEFTGQTSFEDDLTVLVIKIADIDQVPLHSMLHSAKFVSDFDQLKAVREFVYQICIHAPGDAKRMTASLQLAVNEAFCNIVKHGYQGDREGEIIIQGEFTNDGILFDIADKGNSFNPTLIQDPSFFGDRDSGFGFYMIKEVADQVSYRRKESVNGMNHLCILKKYITQEQTMEMSHQSQNNILTICPKGAHLDAKEAPLFKKQIIDLISDTHIPRVVLDLKHLHFIDSSGLGSLLSLLRVVNSQGGDLKMAGVTNPIRTVFELVCMHKIFEIYNTAEEAAHSFK